MSDLGRFGQSEHPQRGNVVTLAENTQAQNWSRVLPAYAPKKQRKREWGWGKQETEKDGRRILWGGEMGRFQMFIAGTSLRVIFFSQLFAPVPQISTYP